MIRQIYAMTVKELALLRHDRQALALLFAMPVFFIFTMSITLQGVFEIGSSAHPVEILIVKHDRGREADQVIADLANIDGIVIIETVEAQRLTRQSAENLIKKGKADLALHFKASFSEHIASGFEGPGEPKTAMALIVDPSMHPQLLASLRASIQGIVERRSVLSRLPDLLRQEINQLAIEDQADMAPTLNEFKPQLEQFLAALNLESQRFKPFLLPIIPLRSDNSHRKPSSTEQNVPGYTIFGVFFIVLTLASSFIQEKNDGTFQRLLTAPLYKAAFIIGKLVPYYLVNLVQIALMFTVGVVFFNLHLGNVPALLMVSLTLSAAASGLGLLVATLGKTKAQVDGLAVMLAITLSAIGGMMVPAFIMPRLMQTLSWFTPHAWALAGYHDVILRGMGVKAVLLEAGVLFGFATLFFLIALWRFRFND